MHLHFETGVHKLLKQKMTCFPKPMGIACYISGVYKQYSAIVNKIHNVFCNCKLFLL